MRHYLFIFSLIFLVTGCSSVYRQTNEPLMVVDENNGYRSRGLANKEEKIEGDNHIILAFSGGGTRAAALSYGVMQELRDTTISSQGQRVNMLKEVDSISSVSGGSFTAAYYGLYGDKLFEDFEDDFLRQSVQSSLMSRFFSIGHLFTSLFTGFDRTEIAVDYYDRTIFKGATFADIPLDKRPYIDINATDLATGLRFNFSQSRFDLICSDLSKYSIARAVTASSAVPVAFPSIVLENYADQCDISNTRQWRLLEQAKGTDPRQTQLIEGLKSYRDKDDRRFIHLVDGGISDNLGLRGIVEMLGSFSDLIYGMISQNPPKNILIILVNAETSPDRVIEQTSANPSIGATIGAFSNVQIGRYNLETHASLKNQLEVLQQGAKDRGLQTQIYFSEVSFKALVDKEASRFFNNLPTSLELSGKEIDTLIASSRLLLRREPEFMRFIENNEGELTETAASVESLCNHLNRTGC